MFDELGCKMVKDFFEFVFFFLSMLPQADAYNELLGERARTFDMSCSTSIGPLREFELILVRSHRRGFFHGLKHFQRRI